MVNQTFTATLSHQDMKKHLPYPVQIPPGVRSLRVRLSYAPHIVERINNLLTLTILDPDGFRGAAHRHGEVVEVVIQENAASPGFYPGPIQPGAWTVLVDTHMIMPGAPLRLELVVTGAEQPDASLPVYPVMPAAARPARGPGWYRGDFHAHTVHSDGDWDVTDLLACARANQLDFVTLSDHNTVTGLAQFESACPPELLPICGIELTTFWGHALALGRRSWVDWRIAPGQREMADIASEIEAQGGLFVIAHPEAVGDPYCTGCNWRYADMRPGSARVVEAWNSPWDSESNNEAGLALAYEWMRRGLRMVLTAGSDVHSLPLEACASANRLPGAPRVGFNVVYAEDLSEAAILSAVRAGHLYLSSGPAVRLTAQAAGQTLMCGDSWVVPPGETIRLTAACADCPPDAYLELVVDGEKGFRLADGACDLPGGQTGWALLTLRASNGEMLALTNPIYFDGR